MLKIIVKDGKKKKTYFPIRINRYNEYRKKLKKVLEGNPNLLFEGVREFPSGQYGILINGMSTDGIRPISLFYSLRDINFFYFKNRERANFNKG